MVAGIIVAVLAVLTSFGGIIWFIVKRHRDSISRLEEKIAMLDEKIETQRRDAVTVTTFRDALREVLSQLEKRISNYDDLMKERFRSVNEKQVDMKGDLGDIRKGQEAIREDIAALPCPGPRNGKCL